MYIWGTANPKGEGPGYNGLFLTGDDICGVVQDESLLGLPVKIEHKGVAVGKVVTAWESQGKLDILVDVDERILEGNIVSRFVRDSICRDFSLGYTVGMKFSDSAQTYTPTQKKFNEVSIVRSGAREQCHIHGYTARETKRAKKS